MMAQTGNCRQHIFDVAMPPVLALDLGNRSNVPGAECISFGGQKHQHKDEEKK